MENTVRSLWGADLQSHALLGRDFELTPNTTLNEKFNIQSLVAPAGGVYPIIKGFSIGNKGHKYITDATSGLSKNEPYQHEATDAALFNHIPFVIRKATNDISSVDRAKYAMRVPLTLNGIAYIGYYIKRIDTPSVALTKQLKTIVDGVTTTTTYVPTSANLNPTPTDLSTGGANTVSSTFAGVSGILDLSLTSADMTELMNVASILYGDSGYAIVSELGIVTGVDKVVSGTDSSGNNFNYTELIAAQIHTFYSTYIDCSTSSNGADLILNAGVSEPLYKIG